MNTIFSNAARISSRTLKLVLAVLVVGAIAYGCKDDKIEAPDLNAEVGFVGDSLSITNPSNNDWKNVNILIDEVFAYHVDVIPAKETVLIDLIKFENENNMPFPAGLGTPEVIFIDSDMGRYWGNFEK